MKRNAVLALLVVLTVAGCGGAKPDGPPRLAMGQDECASCRMTLTEPGFSPAARLAGGQTLAYDAIECLVGDLRARRGDQAPVTVWLPDLPTGVLHEAAVMTIVLADYPSPMGGGFAAFRDSTRAADEAKRRDGVAGDLEAFVSGTLQRPER